MKKIIILVLFSIAISPSKADSIETDNNEIINRALQYYLIEDKFTSLICSGFYEDWNDEGEMIICLEHPFYVKRETIKELENEKE